MAGLLEAIASQELIRNAFLAGLLASVACGMVGSYVVTRRISYIAGAIAHCVLGGMGAAWYLRTAHGLARLHPLHGAVVAALAAAVVIGLVSLRARERADTVIGAVWAIGMAIGLLFIQAAPSYPPDLMSYLFADILMVRTSDLALVMGLDVLVIVLASLFYNQFLAVCFDEEFARLRGMKVEFYYLLLLCLTALTVVLLVAVVGVVLVIALLTLPAAVAGRFSRTLWQMMAAAVALCAALTCGGLAASYSLEWPSGPTIIVLAGAVYLGVACGAGLLRRVFAGRAAQEA